MLRVLFPLLAAIMLLGDGLLFGMWTNRWQTPDQLAAGTASLEHVPFVFGDWHGETLPPLEPRVAAQAGFSGYIQRRYDNRRTGATVSILLACGPFGPLSVHTPEVCYAGSGFVQQGNTTSHTEEFGKPAKTAQFWAAKFGKPDDVVTSRLKIFWAWNAGQGWQAPENPRLTFGGAPVLFKLYVTYGFLADDDRAAEENCHGFIRELLPELNKSLAFNP